MPANYRYHLIKKLLIIMNSWGARDIFWFPQWPVSISVYNGPWYYPPFLLEGTYLAGSILWSLREIGFTGARPLHSGWCKGRPGSLCGWRTAQFLAPASLMPIKIKLFTSFASIKSCKSYMLHLQEHWFGSVTDQVPIRRSCQPRRDQRISHVSFAFY